MKERKTSHWRAFPLIIIRCRGVMSLVCRKWKYTVGSCALAGEGKMCGAAYMVVNEINMSI